MRYVERKAHDIEGQLRKTGLPVFLQKLVSNRVDSLSDEFVAQLNGVFEIEGVSPFDLPDMKKAVEILSEAKKLNKKVLCVVDYDTDGISSGAVLYQGLGESGVNVAILVTNRHEDGYGFSEGTCNKVLGLEQLPDVLITADLGSSDGFQLKRLQDEYKSQGRELSIIVTDHHHISQETPPSTVDAFINPHRTDVFHVFTHPICGAAVAWMLLKAFYEKSEYPIRMCMGLLDYVAVATVGDMVSMADPLNRAMVVHGLNLMNSVNNRLSWQVLMEEDPNIHLITEEVIGFKISPRINALSRMGDNEYTALEWLVSDDYATIKACFTNMGLNNEDRKEEQFKCEEASYEIAQDQLASGAFVCSCYVPEFSTGVVGLAASNIVNKLGVPAIVLSRNDIGEVTASCRSIPGFDIRQALHEIQETTGMFKKSGGHSMAAGFTLASEGFVDDFFTQINSYAESFFEGIKPEATYYYDGPITNELRNVAVVKELRAIAPFGQEFPPPSYLITGLVSEVQLMGSEKNHAKIKLSSKDVIVWFKHGANAEELIGKNIEAVVSTNINKWRETESVQFLAQAVREVNVG